MTFRKLFPSSGQKEELRLAISEEANRVGVITPSPEDGKSSSFRNALFSSFLNTGLCSKAKVLIILSEVLSDFDLVCQQKYHYCNKSWKPLLFIRDLN
jgi:hypothetical protein